MAQAKGAKAQLLLDYESTFGEDPGSAAAYKLPINSLSLISTRAKSQAATITGNRNPVEPFDGNVDVSGDAVIPVDGRALLYWLKLMFGASTRSDVPALNPDAGAAVNVGSGVVGIPCTGHGLEAGSQILIAGTTNYNAVYTVLASSTANQVNVTASYVAESFDGSETMTPCIRLNPDASAAVEEGGGLVGIPCASHGLPVGAEITIAGTTNYNDTYTVERGTTASVIFITETYNAETFDGSETITAYFHDHLFKIGDSMPSAVADKGFTDISQYFKYNGVRASSLSLEVGGDGELTATVGLAGAKETRSGSAYDASAVDVQIARLANFKASITEGGSALSNCSRASISLDFGLDTGEDQYVLGNQGQRGDLPEGICQVSGRVRTLFEDAALLDKALNSTESSVSVVVTRASSHHRLTIACDEVQYERNSPGIEGPRGVMVDLPFMGYYGDDADASAVKFTLRTEIKSFT